MSLNEFPNNLDEYFLSLSKKYGQGQTSLVEREPWYFRPGIKFFTALHSDQAVRRTRNSQWHELRTLYSLQIARSTLATTQSDQVSHFESVCGQTHHSRGFGQLPCTVKSIHARVEAISKMISKESPILVIGDDDALSIALAKNGFKDITVFEIDPVVVEKLQEALKKFPNTKSHVVQHDIFNDVPETYRKNYALAAFDPWYAMDGLKAFMHCALHASLIRPKILLSFNCGALLNEYNQLVAYLKQIDYDVASWIPLANTYPMPKNLQRTLRYAEFLGATLSCKKFFPLNRTKKLFFSSDLIVLTPFEVVKGL